MLVVVLRVIILLAFAGFCLCDHQDYPDSSGLANRGQVTYERVAVISPEKSWIQARDNCIVRNFTHLVRVKNKHALSELKDSLYNRTTSNYTGQFWVGIKYTPNCKFVWDDGQKINNASLCKLNEIVNTTKILSLNEECCFAIANDSNLLQPLSCGRSLAFACERIKTHYGHANSGPVTYERLAVISPKENWTQARNSCIVRNYTNLVRVRNERALSELKDWLYNRTSTNYTGEVWVGIKYSPNCTFVWDDGQKINNPCRKLEGIVNRTHLLSLNETMCFAITNDSKLLQPLPCGTPLAFACERIKKHCGRVYRGPVAYERVKVISPEKNWTQARDNCIVQNYTHLVRVKNNDTLSKLKGWLYNRTSTNYTGQVWVGIKYTPNFTFVWDDGQKINNASLHELEDIVYATQIQSFNKTMCFAIANDSKLLQPVSCERRLAFVCERIKKHGGDDNKDELDLTTTNKFVIRVSKPQKNWTQARKYCSSHLVRVKTNRTLGEIKDWLYNNTVKNPPRKYWVGIKRFTNGTFVWDDGKVIEGACFKLKNIVNTTQTLNNTRCYAITNDSDLLQPVSCETSLGFVCERKREHCEMPTTPSVPSTTPSSPSGVLTSASTPESPSTPSSSSPGTASASTPESLSTPSSSSPGTASASTPESTSTPLSSSTGTASASTPKSTPTPADVTSTPQGNKKKVDEFIRKMKKVNMTQPNSINEVLNITSSLLKDLKKDKAQKGNVMRATVELEQSALRYAKIHFQNSNYSDQLMQTSDGLLLQIMKITKKQEIEFPPKVEHIKGKGGETTIVLPDALFGGQDLYVVNALFTEVSDNIQASSDNTTKDKIISPVISSTLDPKPVVFEKNVTITLEHFEKPSNDSKRRCVFWESNNETSSGGNWSTRGCTVIHSESDENRTVCSCNHLTSFALLMQVDNTPSVNEKHRLALSYITYIGCAFSLLGEVLTVLAYILLMNMKQEQSQIRVNLAISLAVAQILFLSGITATSNPGVCTFVGVMLHYFYLVAFGWMMLEGVYLYLMVVKVFNTIVKMKLYYIFAWGFPIIAVGISLIIASTSKEGILSYTHEDFCWVSFTNDLIWAFVVPVILISLVNLVILIFVVREMTRLNKAKSDDMDSFRRGVKACVVLFPLLGLTWVFGLLSVTKAGIVFQYIFTILNSFQGFLIFVLHCLRSGEIRNSCNRKLQRWRLTQSSNFTTSKSSHEHTVSTSDKNPLRNQFTSTESLQENYSRHNRVTPVMAEMDDRTVHNCITPVDTPNIAQNSV